MTPIIQPATRHRSSAVAAMPTDRTRTTGSTALRSKERNGGRAPARPFFSQCFCRVTHMRNQCLGFVLVVGTAVLAVAQTKSPTSMFKSTTMTPTGKTVARVNGTVLTDRDLLGEMMTIFPYARQHGGKFPASMEVDIRRGALDMLEFEELVYQEANRRNLKVAPSRLDTGMKEFREQFQSSQDYHSYLKAECDGSTAKLREKIRRSMMIEDVLRVEVSQRASVSETEVQTFYQKNPARFFTDETISIQTISLVIPDHATPDQDVAVRKRADD